MTGYGRGSSPSQQFLFKSTALRVIEIDGAPWFSATDVCVCIRRSVAGGTNSATRVLAEDEVRVLARADYNHRLIGDTPLFVDRQPTAKVISESGMYKLIMRSDKAEARESQDWVTREVPPSIRRSGGDYPSLSEG